jgi:hypothetical protein
MTRIEEVTDSCVSWGTGMTAVLEIFFDFSEADV